MKSFEEMREPQFKITLPHDLRGSIEKQAQAEGLTLAEAIRRRLLGSIAESEVPPRIRRLQALVGLLASMVEYQTGQHFDRHPATAETLRLAISTALGRMGARSDAKFEAGDMVTGLQIVAGSEPASIGVAIEAIVTIGRAADSVREHLEAARAVAAGLPEDHPARRAVDSDVASLEAQERELKDLSALIAGEEQDAERAPKRQRLRKRHPVSER
jgi:hypothetical protein